MHSLAYVIVNDKDNYIQEVETLMTPHSSNNFECTCEAKDNPDVECECESYGFWDWYVIGGRWSGEFTRQRLVKKYGLGRWKKLLKEFEAKHGWFIGGKEGVTERDRFIQYAEMFEEFYPEERDIIMPAWRDRYSQVGYPDDIIKLSDVSADDEDSTPCTIIPPNGDVIFDVTPTDVDKIKKDYPDAYAVIVDYHN